jgi:hypothetical protein
MSYEGKSEERDKWDCNTKCFINKRDIMNLVFCLLALLNKYLTDNYIRFYQ